MKTKNLKKITALLSATLVLALSVVTPLNAFAFCAHPYSDWTGYSGEWIMFDKTYNFSDNYSMSSKYDKYNFFERYDISTGTYYYNSYSLSDTPSNLGQNKLLDEVSSYLSDLNKYPFCSLQYVDFTSSKLGVEEIGVYYDYTFYNLYDSFYSKYDGNIEVITTFSIVPNEYLEKDITTSSGDTIIYLGNIYTFLLPNDAEIYIDEYGFPLANNTDVVSYCNQIWYSTYYNGFYVNQGIEYYKKCAYLPKATSTTEIAYQSYYNNLNYKTNYNKTIATCDIYDDDGNVVVTAPKQWDYNVQFEPVLNENMETENLKCTVSLSESCIAYCKANEKFFDIVPYISKNSLNDDDITLSFDNAISCFPYTSYYYDDIIKSYKFNNHTGKTELTFNKTYGNSIIYSLNADNNYSVTFELDIKDTSLVSNTDYYFCILGVQWENDIGSNLVIGGYDSLPNRYYFKEIYSQGVILPIDENYKVICSERFSLVSVSKKNSRDNDVGTGGLINSTSNSLNSDYKFTVDYKEDNNYLTSNEVEDINKKNKENYLEETNSSNYDISSLDSLFNSCSQFFGFIKHGYTILPSSVWLLIDGFIIVIIYLRIMGR